MRCFKDVLHEILDFVFFDLLLVVFDLLLVSRFSKHAKPGSPDKYCEFPMATHPAFFLGFGKHLPLCWPIYELAEAQ